MTLYIVGGQVERPMDGPGANPTKIVRPWDKITNMS